MQKLQVINFAALFLLFGCGMSEKDKTEISQITCNVIEVTMNMDAAERIKEVNAAREQMGGERFLGKDGVIKESVQFGLCVNLVRNDEDYQSLLETKKEEKIAHQRLQDKEQLITRCSEDRFDVKDIFDDKNTEEDREMLCEAFDETWSYGSLDAYMVDWRKEKLGVRVCDDVEQLKVLSSEELLTIRKEQMEYRNKVHKVCQSKLETSIQDELEILSEGIKLHCQKDSEYCHEDWIKEN